MDIRNDVQYQVKHRGHLASSAIMKRPHLISLRASSAIWASEVSLARTCEQGVSPAPRGLAARSRVLARLASLAQIGELARRPRLH